MNISKIIVCTAFVASVGFASDEKLVVDENNNTYCSNSFNLQGFKAGHEDFRSRKTPKGKTGGPEYQALHRWVSKELGKPQKCRHCGIDGLTGRKIHWASKSRLYKWNLKDWIRLCIKCHAKYDG